MHAALIGKGLLEKRAKIPCEVDVASEFRYRDPFLNPKDLVIIVSQSGETADSLAALRLAKKRGIKVMAIVNVVGSSIAREADYVLFTWAGLEIAVASTKAYFVQVAVLSLLANKIAHLKGLISDTELENFISALRDIPSLVKRILEQNEKIQHYASLYQNAKNLFFLGRGLDFALALEASLKLKEISYIHSEAYPAGEMKHGTISLITSGIPVIAIATIEPLYEKMISNIKEVKARGADVLLFCRDHTMFTKDVADHIVVLPNTHEDLMPLVSIVPLQLFAYYCSVLKGLDVDKPRNLAKSVTVE